MKPKKDTELTKPHVVSFRLTGTQYSKLTKIFAARPPVHVKSPKAMARKIVSDYLEGRMVYRDPNHQLADMDVIRI